MVGATVKHYKILAELGRGGMGVVYKAEDTILNRPVALKFLSAITHANSNESARFLQEARAISSLSHSNIATIYSFEEYQGQKFIAMEYLEGGTLKDILADGPLSIETVFDHAMQIAEGLAHAHKRGIVHRDLKSENIMLDGSGRLRVTDFGLAKLKGRSKLTRTGSTIGTAAYMSPEQARGEEVDHRSDLFSFGVVLFELITGTLPFRGLHEAALMYEIVHETPKDLKHFRGNIPPDLQVVVDKLLAKNREERYQSGEEVLGDLQAARAVMTGNLPPALRRDSRSVLTRRMLVYGFPALMILAGGLYFLSKDQDSTAGRISLAIADCINETDEPQLNSLAGYLTTTLEQSRHLSVLTRSTMDAVLKGLGHADIPKIDEAIGREISKKMNISVLAVPTVRKFGDMYSVDLKLIDPNKDEYLYALKEEGSGEANIPQLIDRLGEKVRLFLKEGKEDISRTSTPVAGMTSANITAYEHYFKGEQFLRRNELEKAGAEYVKAIALDSGFALAYFRLNYVEYWLTPAEREDLRKKLAQNFDRLPERERLLAQAGNVWTNRLQEIVFLKAAESKYPDDRDVMIELADNYADRGIYDTAVTYVEKLYALDPTDQAAFAKLIEFSGKTKSTDRLNAHGGHIEAFSDPLLYRSLANAWLANGRIDSAISISERGLARFPLKDRLWEYHLLHNYLNILILAGEFSRGRALIDSLWTLQTTPQMRWAIWRMSSDFTMYTGEYRKALDYLNGFGVECLVQKDTARYESMMILRCFLLIAGWNQNTEALRELDRLVSSRGFPHSPGIWIYVIGVLANAGKLHEAQRIYHDRFEQTGVSDPSLAAGAMRAGIYLEAISGDCETAIRLTDSLVAQGEFPGIAALNIAECQFARGNLEGAIETIRGIDSAYRMMNVSDFLMFFHPRTYSLLGRIYEKQGNKILAEQYLKKFLEIWRDADQDLIERVDAKKRLASIELRRN